MIMDISSFVVFLIILGVFVLFGFILWKFRLPKFGCITLVTGGVKTGKSMLSVYLAYRKYKRVRLIWRIKCYLCKMLRKDLPEEPLFYSNVKLAGVPYTLLTKEALERKVRLAKCSVAYIQEASLVADSQMFKDMELNERLTFFNKLYGHETYGGTLIYDTQCIGDVHFSVRRALSTYFWIHHNIKVPFFVILYIREMIFSEDNGVVNVSEDDVESQLRMVIVPKSVWKMYDAYCYSALTDDLPLLKKIQYNKPRKRQGRRLKLRRILSFREFLTINKENHNEK